LQELIAEALAAHLKREPQKCSKKCEVTGPSTNAVAPGGSNTIRGNVYRESAHSQDRAKAVKLLKHRLGESVKGRAIGSVAQKVTMAEMKEVPLADYRLSGNRSLSAAKYFAENLISFFGQTARALDSLGLMVLGRRARRLKIASHARGPWFESRSVHQFARAALRG